MSIEFKCSGCGNALRVQDEQAGRQAKCPVCDQLTTVPLPSEAVVDSEQPDITPPVGQPSIPLGGAPEGAAAAGMRPHRGALILVFGIFSLFCCGLLGIAPWIMANEDLMLMDRRLMDPTGRGMTMAGKVLGIIGLVLYLLSGIIWVASRS